MFDKNGGGGGGLEHRMWQGQQKGFAAIAAAEMHAPSGVALAHAARPTAVRSAEISTPTARLKKRPACVHETRSAQGDDNASACDNAQCSLHS